MVQAARLIVQHDLLIPGIRYSGFAPHDRSNPFTGLPSTRANGRCWRSYTVVCGSMPRQWYNVAIRSCGETGVDVGYAAILSEEPYTCPPRTPPPASSTLKQA